MKSICHKCKEKKNVVYIDCLKINGNNCHYCNNIATYNVQINEFI